MTLKEKFDNIISQSSPIEWESQCEQTADEFAIGFAEWILDWPEDWHRIGELLEIYKDEKGL